MGVQGVQVHPKSFDLLKIWAKSPRIREKNWKFGQNPWKSGKKMAPNICTKTHEDHILKVTPKKSLTDLCERKFVGKISHTKTFHASLGKFGQKSFAPPKNLPASSPMVPNPTRKSLYLYYRPKSSRRYSSIMRKFIIRMVSTIASKQTFLKQRIFAKFVQTVLSKHFNTVTTKSKYAT